jgi:selenocysteine lyase/cysteine desulfurase
MSTPNGTTARAVPAEFGHEMRKLFLFDNDYVNLNHGLACPIPRPSCPQLIRLLLNAGSFGTYPAPIRTALRRFQDRAEARPDIFIRYEYPKLLDRSRALMGKYLNAPEEEIVFVPNATTGVNTVLRNLRFEKGDKIAYFATIYGACAKTVEYVCETTPAESVMVEYEYPISDEMLVERFRDTLRRVKKGRERVKVAIFDMVVSLPGVRMPFERLTEVCQAEGVLSLIDGAQGLGHIPLDLGKLRPDFFIGSCHKHVPHSFHDARCGITCADRR